MKKWILIFLLILCIVRRTELIYAEESAGDFMDLYDFSAVDRQAETQTGKYTFSEMVKTFASGDLSAFGTQIKENTGNYLFGELKYHRSAFLKIVMLAVLSALFSNVSIILNKPEISETGFFITYLLVVTILMGAFSMMSDLLLEVTENITAFMETAIPALALSAGLCCGQATALGFGEIALFIIYAGEKIIKIIILPMIKLYVVIMSVNHLLSEDYLSKFGNILKTFVLWFLKGFTAVVMGINLIKGMILPGLDFAGKNTAAKLVNLLPGGEELTTAGNIFLSSAAVVKNAIGTTAVFILFAIILVPMIKMFAFVITYKIMAALIQPVADKRLAGCVDCTTESVLLLNKVLITQFVMLTLSVALLCLVTN